MEILEGDLLPAKPEEAFAAINRCRVRYRAMYLSSCGLLLGAKMVELQVHAKEIELEWCISAVGSRADYSRISVTMYCSNVRSELV